MAANLQIFNPIRLPSDGTLCLFLLRGFFQGMTDKEAVEAAIRNPDLDTVRTSINSVRRRRYEFREEGHAIPSNAQIIDWRKTI